MRIQKMAVKNYRGIGTDAEGHGVEIAFDTNNVILLCGPNNAGKSSLLHAYEFFTVQKRLAEKSDFYQADPNNNIQIEVWVRAETEADREVRAFAQLWDDEGIAKIRKTWTAVGGEGEKHSFIPGEGWQLGGAGGFDSLLQNACPTPVWIRGAMTPEEVVGLLEVLVQEAILKQLADRPVYEEAVQAVQRLEEEIRDDQYTTSLREHLNNAIALVFPKVSFELKNEGDRDITDLFKKKTTIAIREEGRPDLAFIYHGHGVRRQFIMSAFRGLAGQLETAGLTAAKRKTADFNIADIVDQPNSPKSKILLIEEPELYLHPEAMRCVKELIYSLGEASEFQVFAATHAPIMVDLAKPHSTLVRCSVRETGGVAVAQVSSDLFEEGERDHMKMLNYFDPYVCEAFFSDKVLLVEGDTECVAIRRLKDRMVRERTMATLQHIHVVNCGTKNNIPFFQKILTNFRIPYWVFHDLDCRLTPSGSTNSAWTLNRRIGEEIDASTRAGLAARRFVFDTEFESANGYEHNPTIGKPFSASEQAKNWDLGDETKAAVRFLRVVAGEAGLEREFDQAYLEELAP